MAAQQQRSANQTQKTATKRRVPRPPAHGIEVGVEIMPRGTLERAVEAPQLAPPGAILSLQRTAGNQAISGLIQAKLQVGPANDRYEQEADRVADQVMRMPTTDTATQVQRQTLPEDEELLQSKPLAATITPVVQRQELPEDEELLQGKSLVQRQAETEEEEELLQPKSLVQRQELPEEEELLQGKSLVQRQELPEEEELLQGKSLVQRQELDEDDLGQRKPLVQRQAHGGFQAGDDVERRLSNSRGSGSPLPDHLLSDMEARFGNDFGAVRVHTGGEAEQLNRSLSARAFTHGSDIYMGSSQYSPDSTEGQRLLAHELTHVVQQTGHRAKTARSATMRTQPHSVQRDIVIQRAVTDSAWADLLPKEKTSLTGSGFFDDEGKELQPPGHNGTRKWNDLQANERSLYYEKAQAKVSLTEGSSFERGSKQFNELAKDEQTALRTLRTNIDYTRNLRITSKKSAQIISRVQAYNKLSAAQKNALVENYGISNATEYASVPDGRVLEVHKLLEEVKKQGEMQKEKETRGTEEKNLKEKPGFWEMAGEGWKGFGTSIKRGARSLFGLGMSSNTAKRRIYTRRRQQILQDRVNRGQMPTRQRSLRARPAPAPKTSGPSSDDLKNIMQAVQAIQGLENLNNKDTIIRALLAKAGMG